ncbi:MAG: hypothetical protein LJE83_06050 [Gammaproteobacteria bacterium]|nr:hypothetical protein [Gammaproteobacteria bacterium]
MEKSQILQQGLKQLNDFVRTEKNLPLNENLFIQVVDDIDDHGAITINNNDSGLSYTALLQPWAPQKDINALITQIKSLSSNVLLIADFVNPVMAEKFRRRSISFVDCAGNLFIKDNNSNYYVKGKKPSCLRARRVRGRAFNTAGLKLIYAIFNHPKLLHATYRDISKIVKIALGSIGPVIDDLHASGYILDDGQRRLVNKKRLFERWVDGYLEKLRPQQILACYTSDNENWWKNARPAEFDGMWGGEVTVAKSTPFMMPETVTLYFSSDEKHRNFADHYDLKMDDNGEICVYKTFWPQQTQTNAEISPMIMYADIVDSINPGNWDVAKTFYGEAVAHLLYD